MNKCLRCSTVTTNWYCRYHYLEKEKNYGLYDVKILNRGFIWWGFKRIFNFYKLRLIGGLL